LGEPYLLTPGPLTTAYAVKQAMLRDWGSWDGDFRAMTAEMRQRLLACSATPTTNSTACRCRGSGSFCVEAMLGSFVPRDGKVLVLANGAYGLRIARPSVSRPRPHAIDKGDYLPPRGDEVAAALDADPAITHVILSIARPAPASSTRSPRSRMPSTPRAASCWSTR
jgi:2-aminoethylphosphonate-pyruvate transaminase